MTKQYVCGEGGTWSPLARVFSGWKSCEVSVGEVTVLEQIKMVSSRRLLPFYLETAILNIVPDPISKPAANFELLVRRGRHRGLQKYLQVAALHRR